MLAVPAPQLLAWETVSDNSPRANPLWPEQPAFSSSSKQESVGGTTNTPFATPLVLQVGPEISADAMSATAGPVVTESSPSRNVVPMKKSHRDSEILIGTAFTRAPGPPPENNRLVNRIRRNSIKRISLLRSGTGSDKHPAIGQTRPISKGAHRSHSVQQRSPVNVLHESASEIQLPSLERPPVTDTSRPGPQLQRTVSETALTSLDGTIYPEKPTATLVLSSDAKVSHRRSISNRLRRRSRSRGSDKEAAITHVEITELPKALLKESGPDIEEKSQFSLSKLAKRTTWIIGSRSPSPSNRKLLGRAALERNEAVHNIAPQHSDSHGSQVNDNSCTPEQAPSLQRTDGAANTRGLSGLVVRSDDEGRPAVPSLPKALSTDRLAMATRSVNEIPEMPRPKSWLHAPPVDAPRKKDELWSHFRNLDSDFQKFASKPGPLKTNVVRSSLHPFLRAYADHPSNHSIRAEDLDRRVHILNKWWTGLLEMLNGRNGQSVSPNDRPAVLEGVSGIMTRPEWKLPLAAISSRSYRSRTPYASPSASSLDSTGSDFLTESVLHNVRNIFVQNLLSQMAFVVERMSMRNVPASVVTFCGKASAYAFFFCPGVADILVRLWSVPSVTVRRVLDEAGVQRNTNLNETADSVSMYFPSHLRPLAFGSHASLMRYLRNKPLLPLSSAYIPWNGPWVARWLGRDSDLFFGFLKTALSLSCDMLPDDASKAERLCAPCALLIQAQMLSVMDATIHRSGNPANPEPTDGHLPITFDDVLGADASATTLPVRAPNAIRLMAENRLIMLLREFLSESSLAKDATKTTFALTFGDLLKAAARRVSVHDHNACFTLCDFADEAVMILARFHGDTEDRGSFLDWRFWFNVCQKMAESNNTMTEIRLYSFIYGLWGFLTKNTSRKKDLCLEWLLAKPYFDRQFNHWCPMVRAYYMRLLCWRVAKTADNASETDLLIYKTLTARLETTWCYYMYLRQNAEARSLPLPSTAPGNPAPGRRLFIIRNESVPAARGALLSYDGLIAAAVSNPSAYQKYTSLNPLLQAASAANARHPLSPSNTPKKRWALLRNINPFTSGSVEPSVQAKEQNDGKPVATKMPSQEVEANKSAAAPAQKVYRSIERPAPPTPAKYSFRFSLEWTDRSAFTAKGRYLSPPRLPVQAHLQLRIKRPEPVSFAPIKPEGPAFVSSKYCGRALSEWSIIINECQNFHERRTAEGVPRMQWVETPALGIESFRRPIG